MATLVERLKGTKCHEAPLLNLPSPQREVLIARYWSRVDKRGPNECWEWSGSMLDTGYGNLAFWLPPKVFYAPRSHRIAWVLEYNMLIPKGLLICHRCDNRICCNPNHLFLGTMKTNLYDRDLKKRCGGKWRESKTKNEIKKKIIVDRLSFISSISTIAIKYKVATYIARDTLRSFLKSSISRDWLPEPLKSRYAHCRSWREVLNEKKKYECENTSTEIKSTQQI